MRDRIMRMLDVVSLVKAVRQAMLGLDRPSALVVFVLSFLGSLVTGTFTWIVDWLPTWKFANGEPPADISYSAQSVADAAIENSAAMAEIISGMGAITLGAFIGASLAVGVTLLPTIIQFIAPRVLHPIARTTMDASIGFDFITDWPSAWQQAGGVAEFVIFRGVVTIVLVFVYSMLVQSVFVLFLVACVFSAKVLISGEERVRPVTVIEAGH